MNNTNFVIVFLVSFIFYFANAQTQIPKIELDNWQTYTSLLNSTVSDFDSKGRIWVGTNGGAYCYNPSNKSVIEFRNIDAMLSLDVTAVSANLNRKEVYIGTFDGILEIADEDFNWTHITDITKPNFPSRKINHIIFAGKIAYIAGGFGLTTFDTEEHIFLQTPARLGSFQPLTNVNKLHINQNTLWAATDEGIASVSLDKSIINPDSWLNFTSNNGLPKMKIKGITSHQNEIYCFTDTAIYKLSNDTSFIKIRATEPWNIITEMGVMDNKVIFTTLFNVLTLDDQLVYNFTQVLDTALINGFTVNSQQNTIIVNLLDAGFVLKKSGNQTLEHIKPESPVSNLFLNLDIDTQGNLWTATDYTGGKGFMRFNKGQWTNYTRQTHPELITNDYFYVKAMPDGRILLSSWGFGFITLTPNGDEYDISRTDNTNSCMTGVSGNQNFVVTGGITYDPRNNSIWAINYAPNFLGNLLMGINNAGETVCSVSRSTREFIPIAVDFSGTKWMGSTNGYGLQYFNEGSDFKNPADDKMGVFTSSNSQLPSSNINCLAVDKSGVVWIGTPNGLAYILSPSAVLRDANPIIRESSIRVFSSLPINDIMVDALNNKWIATNQGVFIIDPDGFSEIGQLTTNNSPLISNEVVSLATDENTGKIYFGTRKGLSEVQSFSVKPLDNYEIKAYPQPFYPLKNKILTIEGLAAESDIRIVSPDGKLVKSLFTTSQKLIWDGTDNNGNIVNTGVYLILGTSLSTNSSAVAKIAVILD